MIIGEVILYIVGAILLMMSIFMCFGHVGLMHSYHHNHVKKEDMKKFGIATGLSLMLGAVGILTGAILLTFIKEEYVYVLSMLLTTISLSISIILELIFIKKYNGAIFG